MAAGLGFKTFTTGEVLTAADTNGYLMQGVLVFASSAARAAAITSPQEGQYSYLKDTNSTEYYDGAAWIAAPIGDITGVTAGTGISGGGTSGTVTITNSMATEIAAKGDLIVGTGSATFDNLGVGTNGQVLTADSTVSPTGLKWATASSGAVLQVKNAIKTSYQVITATSNIDITDMSVSITPSSASNKVLVLVSINGVSSNAGTNRARILLTDGSGTQLAALNDYPVLGTPQAAYSISYLDSPGSTAAKTYKLMGNTVDAASGFTVNNYQSITIRSTITVMEVTP